MYVVTVEFTIKPELVERFRERVLQQARDSLAGEQDCHVFDVCIDAQREEIVFLYEVYSDRSAFDVHLNSVHFVDFDLAVRNWVSDKQVVCFERI
jgi:autoinducer 2-degrading protein